MDPNLTTPAPARSRSRLWIILVILALVLVAAVAVWKGIRPKDKFEVLNEEPSPKGEVVADLPTGMVLITDAEIKSSKKLLTSGESGEAEVSTVVYATTLDLQTMRNLYGEYLRENGWAIAMETPNAAAKSVTIFAKKAGETLSLVIKESEATEVTIQYRKPVVPAPAP